MYWRLPTPYPRAHRVSSLRVPKTVPQNPWCVKFERHYRHRVQEPAMSTLRENAVAAEGGREAIASIGQ
jgi:hypothetical protein